MATKKKLKTSGGAPNVPSPSIQQGLSPVAQMLQNLGGPAPTKGLNPLADVASIGANNANLNSGMLANTQNIFGLVGQKGAEALRQTENNTNRILADQQMAKQQAIAAAAQKAQNEFQMKMQAEAIAAQKALRPPVPKVTSAANLPTGISGPVAPPKLPATVSTGKKSKNVNLPADTPKDRVQFPESDIVGTSGTKGHATGDKGLVLNKPKCEFGFTGLLKRGLGLCQ